ncbi:MAG: hypothetical protein J5720_04860 [Bacteroidaceae bacterium]|nr:hypothetical protein [Bacteroidaceae bacterium]
MKQKLFMLIVLVMVCLTGWAQETPKAQLIYCSCSETPHGVPDKGKDFYELVADPGTTPKVVKCTDAGMEHMTKTEYNVTAADVKRMQQLLQDLDVGKLKDYNQEEDMMGGSTYRVYMEYADGSKINATWLAHHPRQLAEQTYAVILRNLSLLCTERTKTPETHVKHIREVYAEAKKMVAANGKEGKAPQDMTITLNDGTEVDEDFIINEETELKYYFKKKYEPTSSVIDGTSICYYMTENFSAHGHTRYRELLFDPKEGHLIFVFTRQETDAGFVTESRHYYDATGHLVEQLDKAGGKDVAKKNQEPFDASIDLELAKTYQDVFEIMVNNKDVQWEESNVETTPKNDRMKMIRSTYAKAKEKIAKNDKSDLQHDIQIVIHDQLAEDYPPGTKDFKMYFEQLSKDEASVAHCYFISKQMNTMYAKEYAEYLPAPDSHKLIFSYTQDQEEGETYEFRYYFDENVHCIEEKIDFPDELGEGDMGVDDKQSFTRYMKVFELLTNEY